MPTTAVERLVSIIDGVCAAIAARGPGWVMTAPLMFLAWRRLRRIAARAVKLAAQIAAGAPPAPRPRAAMRRPPPPTPEPPNPEPPTLAPPPPRPPRPPPLRLPGIHAWVVRLIPGTAGYGTQLQSLLADPEMAPLLAFPSLRRALNPLCGMLGVPRLKPLPPPAPAAVAPAPPAPPAAAIPPKPPPPEGRGTDPPAASDPPPPLSCVAV